MDGDEEDSNKIALEGPSGSTSSDKQGVFPGLSITADRRRKSIQSDDGIGLMPTSSNNKRRMSLSTIDDRGRKVYKCPKPWCSKIYKGGIRRNAVQPEFVA